MTETVAWLKRSENGSLGEARARSFLLDRFWVLERSVDKDGADYLIQRRLTSDNFLNRESPRLGVVQVKFIQDTKTSIYLHPDYVSDKNGSPYSEFFLLIHTGNEDNQRQFLITAREITEDFQKSQLKNDVEKYYLPGEMILKNSKYEITNKKRALDKIEHALKNADFMRNRNYFFASQYIKVEKHHIDNDYIVPIDNGYCEIDKEFYENKQKLQSTLYDLEEVTEAIGKILRSTDPIEAFNIFESEIEQHISSGGWGKSLTFGVEFFDEDFIEAVKNHKERLKKLRDLNIENDYLNLLNRFEKEVITWIQENKAWESNDVVQVDVKYQYNVGAGNISDIKFAFKVFSFESIDYPKMEKSELGYHLMVLKPASLKVSRTKKDDDPIDIIKSNTWKIKRFFQKEVDKHLLGEELVCPYM